MNIKDRFLRFTYNGINSEEFDMFYENNGEDITFPYSSSFDQKMATSLFQQKKLWLGADDKGKSFSLTIAADKQSMNRIESIFKWLNPNKPGKLRFDFRDNYELDVVIDSISSPVLIPKEFLNGHIETILRFTINFSTINDHKLKTTDILHLKNTTTNNTMVYEPDELLPVAIKVNNTKVNFYNWTSSTQNVSISFRGLSPTVNRGVFAPSSQYGFVSNTSVAATVDLEVGSIVSNGRLIEVERPTIPITNKGPRPIEPGLIFEGKKELTVASGRIKINLDPKMKLLEGSSYMLAIMPVIDKRSTDLIYLSRENGDPYTGLYSTVGGAIVRPALLTGTFSGNQFVFSGATPELSGVQEIKIARADTVEITNANEWSMLFRYTKEV